MSTLVPVEIPYLLKLSGAVTPTAPAMIQMALVTSMNAYMKSNNLPIAEYAKQVQVDKYTIMGIQNNIVKLEHIKVEELYRLLTFHGYNMTIQVEQKQPADGVVDPFMEEEEEKEQSAET